MVTREVDMAYLAFRFCKERSKVSGAQLHVVSGLIESVAPATAIDHKATALSWLQQSYYH
jgi:hypothetical protein